jgi:hypothetical protein
VPKKSGTPLQHLGELKEMNHDAYLAVVFTAFDASLVVNVSPRFVDSIV